jgi:hypothetical protein
LSALPPNIQWALSGNPPITAILRAKYPPTHGYWAYLESLVSELRNASVSGIQQKVIDVANNINKFGSMLAEFEIAKLLAGKGKQVQLLPDSFMSGKSPDLLVTDAYGDYFVEVAQLTEDEALTIILDELRSFLDDPSKPYRVDLKLPDSLSLPVTDYNERQVKEDAAKKIVSDFKTRFPGLNLAQLPVEVTIGGVSFRIVPCGMNKGYPGLVDSSVIVVPSHKYVKRLRYLVEKKAAKRSDWTGNDLKRPYIVAIDCEQVYLFEEDIDEALLGSRETYHCIPPRLVEQAASKGWSEYLVEIHMIPADRTMFKSYGLYLTRTLAQNVSGVLVRRDRNFWFTPNPFAYDEINAPSLANFV